MWGFFQASVFEKGMSEGEKVRRCLFGQLTGFYSWLTIYDSKTRTKKGFNTVSAICTFFWIDSGSIITLNDGPFRAFINASAAVKAVFSNYVSHYFLYTTGFESSVYCVLKGIILRCMGYFSLFSCTREKKRGHGTVWVFWGHLSV